MFLIANWKAYVEDLPKAKTLVAAAKRAAKRGEERIVLAPPAPLMGHLALMRLGPVALAAQDVSLTTGGAHTGEATAQAFAAAGATYALIGHSERRAAGDSDRIVAEKLAHAVAHGLTPVLCVGEAARDADGRYLQGIREQLGAALASATPKERAAVIVAYEPVWAIGKTAADALPPADLAEMTLYIRKVLAEHLPGRSSARAKILYGGSVEPGNARALADATGIDGFLVGHASVDPASFSLLAASLTA